MPHIASVACGAGAADRQALVTGLAHQVDGFDFSEGSLQAAEKQAADEGFAGRLHYRKHDFNKEPIPNGGRSYPLIIIFGGLHHAANLESVLDELERVLAPNGLIFFNEYIGPNRFQYSSDHMEMLNRIISLLPRDFCQSESYTREDAVLLAENDPSEAVRSEEIIDRVTERFAILDRCDYGGSILYPMWASVLVREKLMFASQVSRTPVLQSLMLLEETLTGQGILPPLFSQCVICRKGDVDNLDVISERLKNDARIARPSAFLLQSDLTQLQWPLRKISRPFSAIARERTRFFLEKANLLEPLKSLLRK